MKICNAWILKAARVALSACSLSSAALAGEPQSKVPQPLPLMNPDKEPAPSIDKTGVGAPGSRAPAGSQRVPTARPRPIKSPAGSTPPIAAIDRDRIQVAEVEGVVWVHGRDWKASFDGEHAVFIPFLGS